MKKIILNISLVSLLALSASCDNFQRTDVYPTITVDHSSVTLFEGDEIQLTASPSSLTFKWSTSDESIATVDNSGLVKAIKQGSASILCESGDISFETEVYVSKKVALTDVAMKCDSLI